MRGRAIAGLIGFSLLYWTLAFAFAIGATLGACEPSKPGCSHLTGSMVLQGATVLYVIIVIAGIVLNRRRRR